ALQDRAVLVRGRVDGEAGPVPDEPAPPGAEALHAPVVHGALQLVETAEGVGDRLRQGARGLAAAVRAHDLPEERVVRVPAAVVPHRRLLVLGEEVEVREHLLDRPTVPLGALDRRVQVGDVGRVVLVVVDAHRRLVDVGLQGGVVVRQVRNRVGHCGAPSSGRLSRRLTVMLRRAMTLAYKFEEIAARELKPSLYELDGISRATIEAHYKLYEGYVNKRNEILGKLDGIDLAAANQVYSEIRALKVELSFAIGGIKNHEIYFENLGGGGGDPDGPIGDLIKRDFGSAAEWRADLKASGMAGRGWAWTAYDWDEGRLFNYVGDTQNTYPIWNATPLVALDVYEHAYFLDYQTDRASYIDAFFDNLDWSTINDWASKYQIR